MKYLFYLYMAIIVWFFFWLRPRVNDGRIEQILDKVQFWYTYKLKRGYHWRYLPSTWIERFRDEFYPWYNLRKYQFKKHMKTRKTKS